MKGPSVILLPRHSQGQQSSCQEDVLAPGSDGSGGGFPRGAWRADFQTWAQAGPQNSSCSASSSLEIQCTLPVPECFSPDFLWTVLVQLLLSTFAFGPASPAWTLPFGISSMGVCKVTGQVVQPVRTWSPVFLKDTKTLTPACTCLGIQI